MNNLFLSFIITALSGFSTLLGSLTIFLTSKKREKIIACCLMFSAGIMIYISIIDLIPNSIEYLYNLYELIPSIIFLFIFVIVGILLMDFINKNISSSNNLYKVGIITMIALIIHNIPEGIITFLTTTKDFNLGIKLAISITLHNIPEGISIFIPIYFSTRNKIKAFMYTFIAGFSELIGAFFAWIFLAKMVNDLFFAFLFALTAGIMLQIAIKELIPEALSNYKKKISYIVFLLGIFIMFLSEFLT